MDALTARLLVDQGTGLHASRAARSPPIDDRFMGRYAVGLAPKLANAAGVTAGMHVVDVGCGPGALTAELAGA